jgi:succinate dehydrogenase assembly factor 2
MDEPDWDIYYWATNKKTPPASWADSPVLAKLQKHAKNEGRVVRRMPEL